MSLRAIIVDDERGGREALAALLANHCPSVEVIGMADSAATGAEAIRGLRPDLVFLDIEMPYGNGFDLLEMARGIDFGVIFTTAYDHYAIKAIRLCALDYLLKPIDADELQAAVARAEKELTVKPSGVLEALIQNMAGRDPGASRIALPTAEELLFVQVKDIVRCEAAGNYTIFHFISGEAPIVSRTLKEYEAVLGEMGFFRIHHSHLVNLHHVRRYVKGEGGQLVMCDGSEIAVSRRRKEELLSRLSAL